ncbi:hypothetical protein F4Z99_18650 [Candidatus Poribacteria bacterium]|nr:hypothetical protein [Candidatus Poribacteria bacterium]MYB01143.1 hypothetical protein [Candidatus Poribacteria bacterium]
MLTQKVLHDSQMMNMLNVVVENFKQQGVICEITSPTSFSFSSTLPSARVEDVFEGCSLPLKSTIQSLEETAGCHGSVEVIGLARADE